MGSSINILSAAVSDRGLSEKRPQNEDSYLEMPSRGIFAVADGVGGAQAGEVASQMAMELLSEAFANLPSGSDAESAMLAAIERANGAIHQMAHELPQLASMATTFVALHLDNTIATIGHVGDSRLYRVDREGNLHRETADHSMVAEEVRAGRMTEEQAENHPSRNIINRALGAEASVEPDLKTIMVEPGSAFLLCSDGITRHVNDAEIRGVLNFGGEPADICEYLKGLCFERGAEDNLTAVVVKISSQGKPVDAPKSEGLLDLEENTVTSARSPFHAKVGDDENEILELETQKLLPAQGPLAHVTEEAVTQANIPIVPPLQLDVFGRNESASETQAESMQASTANFLSDSYEQTGAPSRKSLGSWATSLGMLLLGSAIGMAVYYFAIDRKAQEMRPTQPLSEMRSANIPLSAFEENRRNVDNDPAGYLLKYGANPQDCEDFYLAGRAQMLTGDYIKARASLTEARNRLPEADPVNAKTLAADISVALVVMNDTTVQSMLKKELESAPRMATNANLPR